MDAKEYKDITGLDNYFGFKSLLKNSVLGTNFRITDDTIIFNKIVQKTMLYWIPSDIILLQSNQVGVILNASTGTDFWYGNYPFKGYFNTYDVNSAQMKVTSDDNFIGTTVQGEVWFDSIQGNIPGTMTLAIFDLY